jgi:hypothetical protein
MNTDPPQASRYNLQRLRDLMEDLQSHNLPPEAQSTLDEALPPTNSASP